MFAMLEMDNGFQTNALFVFALNNQRCLLVPSRVAVWHLVMPHCTGEIVLWNLWHYTTK